jgi:hypothetical protein
VAARVFQFVGVLVVLEMFLYHYGTLIEETSEVLVTCRGKSSTGQKEPIQLTERELDPVAGGCDHPGTGTSSLCAFVSGRTRLGERITRVRFLPERAYVTHATAQQLLMCGIIDRNPGPARFKLTPLGRDVLVSLVTPSCNEQN